MLGFQLYHSHLDSQVLNLAYCGKSFANLYPGCILTGKSALFRKLRPANFEPICTNAGCQASLWIAPLITDSAIFFLTIYRTRRYLSLYQKSASPYASFSFRFRLPHLSKSSRPQRPSCAAISAVTPTSSFGAPVEALRLMKKVAYRTITVLVRDGALYFFLIFLANLMNTLIFFVCCFFSVKHRNTNDC